MSGSLLSLTRVNTIFRNLFFFYTVIYVLNVVAHQRFEYYGLDISLAGLLYFNVATLLYLYLLGKSRYNHSIIIKREFLARIIMVVIILTTSITVWYSAIDTYDIFVNGDFRSIRNSLYAGDIIDNTPKIVKYARLISAYFRLPLVL